MYIKNIYSVLYDIIITSSKPCNLVLCFDFFEDKITLDRLTLKLSFLFSSTQI